MNKNSPYRLMQGNEAVAEGALAAGVRFFWRVSHYSFHRNCRNPLHPPAGTGR